MGSVSATLLIQVSGLALPLPFALAELSAGHRPVDWPALLYWAPLTGGALGIAYLVYYTGLQRGAVSVVSGAASAWLVVTVLVAVLFFGERPEWRQAGLIAVVMAGILMLAAGRPGSGGGRSQSQSQSRPGSGRGGLRWGLGAMLGIGLAMALLDRVTAAGGPMLAVLLVRALSAMPTYGLARARGVVIRRPAGWQGWALVAAAGILDAAGYVGYNLGIDTAPVALVAPIAAGHPAVTIALAVILERERPAVLHWAGAAVTVGGTIGLSALAGV